MLTGMREQPEPERLPSDADEPLGGDPACWLHLVCPSCGVVLDRTPVEHGPGCIGTTPYNED